MATAKPRDFVGSEPTTRPGAKRTGTTTKSGPLARNADIRRPVKRRRGAKRVLWTREGVGLFRPIAFIIQLRFDNVSEPPSADPHARWCGGWGLDTLSYPISLFFVYIPSMSNFDNDH